AADPGPAAGDPGMGAADPVAAAGDPGPATGDPGALAAASGNASSAAAAAARFSSLTASQISSRKIGSPSGAAIPRRTVWPLTSMTVTRTSSPITTRSPARRVSISMGRDYAASANGIP